MPRPVIDLCPYKQSIEDYLSSGYTYDRIIVLLRTIHGLEVSVRTLRTHLASWGLNRSSTAQSQSDSSNVPSSSCARPPEKGPVYEFHEGFPTSPRSKVRKLTPHQSVASINVLT